MSGAIRRPKNFDTGQTDTPRIENTILLNKTNNFVYGHVIIFTFINNLIKLDLEVEDRHTTI